MHLPKKLQMLIIQIRKERKLKKKWQKNKILFQKQKAFPFMKLLTPAKLESIFVGGLKRFSLN